MFFRSFERADFILRGFELLYVATGVIRQTKIGDEDGEPGQLILKYDKKLVGAAVFQSMNIIDFSRTKEESSRLKEQSAFDTTSVYRLQKALGIGTWDWRDDPRGMSRKADMGGGIGLPFFKGFDPRRRAGKTAPGQR